MVQVTTLVREFSYNGVALPDPGASLTLEQVRDVYSATFPEIVTASIEGPETKGGKLIYTFRRAVGTKGASIIPFGTRPLTRVVAEDGLMYIRVIPANEKTLSEKISEFIDKTGATIDRFLFAGVQ